MSSGISRRSVIQAAGIGTALAATGFSLTACSSSGNAGGDVGSAGKSLAPFPTYVPWNQGPTPDLPATAQGVQAGYKKYPSSLAQAVAEKPGDGSKITVWFSSWSATPLPRGKNQFWKAVEEALGVELDITVVPAMEYSKKLTTLMASGQMPDILQITPAANESRFVLAKCQDLSDFISGDNIKKYPNLANIPTYAWKAAGRFAGALFGVPVERPIIGHQHIVNQEKFKQAGLLVPEVGGIGVEEFTKGLQQLSGKGKFAIGAETGGAFGFNAWMPAFGTPNMWMVKDGAFVNYLETDEFQAGLEQMVEWQQAGIFRTDALTIDGVQAKTEFLGQKVYSRVNSSIDFSNVSKENKGQFTIDIALPFKPSNGATPVHWLGGGTYGNGYTVLKKAPKARIELLLRVMDALAAPFGSKEWELFNYGVEDVHFKRNTAGDPVPSELALSGGDGPDSLPVKYVAAAPLPLYIAGQPDAVQRQYDFQQKVIPIGVSRADIGLRTNAWTESQQALEKQREDAMKDIVTGRKKLSDWPAVIEEFKRKGGAKAAEALATEYEAAQKA
ncbi:extracellular solute-binding protein [Streptomyces sp. NPDC007861]|uniref:extracellular solute-binding protein n=1 Tax=Streptomyces sp. NPDC007861 TaxID=3154893 RepID=UPI0033C169F5